MSDPVPIKHVYNLKNLCIARLKHARDLTAAGAAKHTRHYEIDLTGSGLEFLPGDSLAVLPTNDPALVNSVLQQLGFSGDETVKNPKAVDVPVRQALFESYSITEVDNKLIKAVAEKGRNADLAAMTDPERKDVLQKYLLGRDVLDILTENPSAKFDPQEFTGLLKKQLIRLYSISSSLQAHPEQVHLTIATVKYESLGRQRGGVCSTFLAERVGATTPLPTFINPGKGFRLPEPTDDTPIIMCGPGTGIAPFRAFCQERRATGANGDAWLFFGEINRASCFFYEDEWNSYLGDGTLRRMDTAFSRDQADKLYVQHKMLEHGRRFYDWLERGAIFYVCGDASKMASDVDKAMHTIIEKEGGRSPEQAIAYIEAMKAAKRYRRDVY